MTDWTWLPAGDGGEGKGKREIALAWFQSLGCTTQLLTLGLQGGTTTCHSRDKDALKFLFKAKFSIISKIYNS